MNRPFSMNSRRGKNGHRSGMFRLTKRKTFLVCVVLFTFWYFFGLEELKFEDFLYPIEVKSAVKNVETREAIRRTWGAQGILNGVKIRTMFNLGRAENNSRVSSQWEFDRLTCADVSKKSSLF
uniref:Hexosyltransferase n=1 Tax=Megaselia scalaris TaxID=36166 RepID=T1GV03_MEGSC